MDVSSSILIFTSYLTKNQSMLEFLHQIREALEELEEPLLASLERQYLVQGHALELKNILYYKDENGGIKSYFSNAKY